MRRAISTLLLLLASACSVSMSTGGFPPQIRTVSVLPFENNTSDPTLAQDVNRAVRDAVQSRLGLRPAAQDRADALVRGTVVRYDADLPIAYQGSSSAGGTSRAPEVTKRQVTIAVDVEIIDQKSGKPLYKGSLSVQGEYDPGREADGRKKALEKLVNDLVTKAQSQW
jgi:hypothetical protein